MEDDTTSSGKAVQTRNLKIVMLKGLPASGKSTWAKAEVLKSNGRIKRINKDDLRAMIDAGKWSKEREKMICAVRDGLIKSFIQTGHDVIVDDTNFAPQHERDIKTIADELGADFEVKFFDTPVEECIARDASRDNRVGAGIIRDMYMKYLYVKPERPPIIEGAPWVTVCDIDGTLAHMQNRSPFEWSKVGEDSVDETIRDLIQGRSVVLVSGRDSVCRKETEAWLKKHSIKYGSLFMRAEGDNRPDTVVKKEIYETEMKGRVNIDFVLDDRDGVVKMWRSLGLKCLQVEEGNF